MDWMNVLEQAFELVIFPVISILGVYLVFLISSKIKDMKAKTSNETAQKYMDMLEDTITSCVFATTQTYVDALKKEGKFDAEAQKIAFNKTYDAVMKILTADAVKYINESVGDLETYVTNRIEEHVKLQKNY